MNVDKLIDHKYELMYRVDNVIHYNIYSLVSCDKPPRTKVLENLKCCNSTIII